MPHESQDEPSSPSAPSPSTPPARPTDADATPPTTPHPPATSPRGFPATDTPDTAAPSAPDTGALSAPGDAASADADVPASAELAPSAAEPLDPEAPTPAPDALDPAPLDATSEPPAVPPAVAAPEAPSVVTPADAPPEPSAPTADEAPAAAPADPAPGEPGPTRPETAASEPPDAAPSPEAPDPGPASHDARATPSTPAGPGPEGEAAEPLSTVEPQRIVLPEPKPERIVLPDAEAVVASPAEPSLFTPYIEPDFEPAPFEYRPAARSTGFEPPAFEDDPLFGPAPVIDDPADQLEPAAPSLIPPAPGLPAHEPAPAVTALDAAPLAPADPPAPTTSLRPRPVLPPEWPTTTAALGPLSPEAPVTALGGSTPASRTFGPPVPGPAPEPALPALQPAPTLQPAVGAPPALTFESAIAGPVLASATPRTPGSIPAVADAATPSVSTDASPAPDPRFRPSAEARLPIGGPGGSGGGQPPLLPPGDAPRGRHASGADHRWGWVAGWTVLGTVLPGSGLIAAGYRRLGAVLLALALAVPVIGAVWYMRSGVVGAVSLGTDQESLLTVAVALIAGALLAVGVMLLTNVLLMRRADPGGAAKLANLLLVTALVAAIGVPAAVGTRYLLITRDTLPSVFGDPSSSANRPNSEDKNPWAGIPRVNVLLIGSDADDARDGTRTDSMILASINTRTGDTVLLSPPRNLQRVPFPKGSIERKAWPYGFGNTRGEPWPKSAAACGAECDLSAVWRWAEDNREQYYPGNKQPGATAIRSAIEGAFGMDIDADVVVDIDGFKAVVDALGGLTVDVKQDLPIGGSSEYPVAKAWLRKGDNQKLDGYHALWYARSRWSTSDYDRMNRQRCVIAALNEQVDPVNLVKAYPALAKAAGDNISTDIATDDLSAWVELALKIKKAQVRSLTITSNIISYAHPDYSEIRGLVRNALEPPAPKPSATPPPVSSPSTGATPRAGSGPKPTTTPTPDPEKAQDVKEVC